MVERDKSVTSVSKTDKCLVRAWTWLGVGVGGGDSRSAVGRAISQAGKVDQRKGQGHGRRLRRSNSSGADAGISLTVSESRCRLSCDVHACDERVCVSGVHERETGIGSHSSPSAPLTHANDLRHFVCFDRTALVDVVHLEGPLQLGLNVVTCARVSRSVRRVASCVCV